MLLIQIVLLLILVLLLSFIIPAIIYSVSKKHYFSNFFHDQLGWCIIKDKKYKKKKLNNTECSVCGVKIYKDEKGVWRYLW